MLQRIPDTITTKEEASRASRFNAELRLSKSDRIKEAGSELYLNKVCDRVRAWSEITINRATGQCSPYFIPKQEDGTILETEAVEELDVCIAMFVRLVAEGRVFELEASEGFEIDFPPNAPLSEKFKAYMDAFRSQNFFDYWTYKDIVDLRHNLYRILGKEHQKGKRKRSLSGEECFSASWNSRCSNYCIRYPFKGISFKYPLFRIIHRHSLPTKPNTGIRIACLPTDR